MFVWLDRYYKLYEGKPTMRPDNCYFVPREFYLAYEPLGPWPMVDKLKAYVHEMKQKKKNDDSVFHSKPNDLELMEFF